MNTEWKDQCFRALDAKKMFENSAHRTRFKELLDCYCSYPFFTRGLCKCMYLSAWDDEHFCILLETLTELALGREPDTKEMRIRGDALEEETQSAEFFVYRLSNAFLDDRPFTESMPESLPEEIRYIVRRALLAAAIIDTV